MRIFKLLVTLVMLLLPALPLHARGAGAVEFGNEISLQSDHGRFLVAQGHGGLDADATDPRANTRFRLVDPDNRQSTEVVHFGDRVALRSYRETWVVAEADLSARADRENLGSWEIWTIVDPENSSNTDPVRVREKVALRSQHGTYLVAEEDGRANADRSAVGSWERWRIGVEWTDFYYDDPLPCPEDQCCRCPDRGRFDGANCFVARPPRYDKPFLYEQNFYYSPSVEGDCPLGSFDGANCKVGQNSSDAHPFLYERGFYLQDDCRVEGWAELHTHMFAEHAWPPGFIWGTVDDLDTPRPEPAADALPCCDGRDHARLRPALTILSEGLTQLGGDFAFLGLDGISSGDSGLHLGKKYGHIGDDCPQCSGRGICRDDIRRNVSLAAVFACNAKSRDQCTQSGYCASSGSSAASIRDDVQPCWSHWPDCDRGDLCVQTSLGGPSLTCSDLSEPECREQTAACTWKDCEHRPDGGSLTCSDLSRDECQRYSIYGCGWTRLLGCRKVNQLTRSFTCQHLSASDCGRHSECRTGGCRKRLDQILEPLECSDLPPEHCANHEADGCRLRDCETVSCRWQTLGCDDLSPASGLHFRDWPAWDTPTHQQHWWGHVFDAHQRGLQILTVSILSADPFARLMPGPYRTPYQVVLDQLNAARRFDQLHDWAEIATSPEEARRIIQQGQLAMVLSLEGNFPFCKELPCGEGDDETDRDRVSETLDEYQSLGLVSLQPVAHFDNTFGGTAVFSQALLTLQWLYEEIHRDGDISLGEIVEAMPPSTAVSGAELIRVLDQLEQSLGGPPPSSIQSLEDLQDVHALLGMLGGVSGPSCELRNGGGTMPCGQCLEDKESCRNQLGLTPLGEWLIDELMARGMLIDIAHLSDHGVADVARKIEQRQPRPYPIYLSHGNPRKAIQDGEFKGRYMEKPSSDDHLELIADVGGVFGQRTGADEMVHTGDTECQGSSTSFAEALKYLVDFGKSKSTPLPVAFAVDMNGMTQQSTPRFVDRTDARTERRMRRAACLGDGDQQSSQSHPVSDDPATLFTDESQLNTHGLGHIGLLGAYVDDLRSIGLPQEYLDVLDSSAESFLRMWERTQ